MKKFIILLTVFYSVFSYSVLSQNDRSNMLKYWRYRSRLKYFVIPGSGPGESQISGIRNKIEGPEPYSNISFGQQGVYFGFYIGTLATEYKLLANNNQDNWQSYYELYLALNAYVEQMDKCEQYWANECSPSPQVVNDGFFIRTSVTLDFLNYGNHLQQLNDGLDQYLNGWNSSSASFGDLPRGHPGWVDNAISGAVTLDDNGNMVYPQNDKNKFISQDEALGIMLGLACIVKCIPENDMLGVKNTARDIADKMVSYMRDGKGGDKWAIYDPCNTKYWGCENYSWGFVKAAEYITGFNPGRYWDVIDYPKEYIWQATQISSPIYYFFNTCNEVNLAAIGDSWRKVETITGIPIITSINTTKESIKDKISDHNSETFWLLLWAFLHNKNVDEITEKSLEQLNNAPCEGPYDYGSSIHAENGWASSYKWRKESWWQNGDYSHTTLLHPEHIGEEYTEYKADLGNFNGLDYMLFYNLYSLYKGDALPGYWSYTDRDFYGDYPVSFSFGGFNPHNPEQGENCTHAFGSENSPIHAFSYNSIESTTRLHNHIANNENTICSGNMVLTATNDILLKPGFLVEEGSNFFAYIDNFSCDEFMTTNKIVAENNEEKEPGVKQQNQSFLNVFPNPVSGKLTVSIRDDQNCSPLLFLTDMYGKALLEKNIQNGSEEIDFSTYPAGVYLIKVVCGNTSEVKKVVKQ